MQMTMDMEASVAMANNIEKGMHDDEFLEGIRSLAIEELSSMPSVSKDMVERIRKVREDMYQQYLLWKESHVEENDTNIKGNCAT